MLRQLARHAHKGDQAGWLGCGANDLILGAYRELYELQETIRNPPENLAIEQLQEDAADLANFAMMIADNIQRRFFPREAS